MALTIQQEPTTPNQANADLLYVLTSDSSSKPQFQYVMEVSDGTDTYKFKQQPNPSDKAVFDIGHMVGDFLDVDKPFKTKFVTVSEGSAKEISTVFYEEFGTSTTSSVALYGGTSGSGVYALNGVVEPNSGDWNFASSSYFAMDSASYTETFSYQHALTNGPVTQSIKEDEYATLSFINGNFDDSTQDAQDIYYIQLLWYNSSGTQIQANDWENINFGDAEGGPRTSAAQFWSAVATNQTNGTRLVHIAAGPQNFDDGGFPIPSNWAYYEISVYGQGDDGLENSGAVYARRRYTKSTGACGYTGTRFAFLNELGGYDYFSFDLADTKQDNITRQTYEKPFVPFSTSTNSAVYNKSQRGSTVYSISYDETRRAESDYLTQAQADWLRQLVESPEVFVQEGTDFLPVVITTSQFIHKTNPRSQKMYTLSIDYKLANQRRSR
jgi:hypothetical protein